jgi:Omp85 superfamily domain
MVLEIKSQTPSGVCATSDNGLHVELPVALFLCEVKSELDSACRDPLRSGGSSPHFAARILERNQLRSTHRRGRLRFLFCALSAALVTIDVPARDLLPSITTRSGRDVVARPRGIPTDEVLEKTGAVVGEIILEVDDIFATETPEEDAVLFRLANRLHIQTHQSTIAQQLLFKTGEPYSHQKLEESERLLRTRSYLLEASIYPIAYRDGRVDIKVHTRDVWTLQPGLSFGRSGGTNTVGIKIEESNFLGDGKQFSLNYKSNVDRKSTIFNYRDPQLFGSWWSLATQLGNSSDGRTKSLAVERPFYSLQTRWTAGVRLLDESRIDSIYDLGNAVDQYRVRKRGATIYRGWSEGLQDSWVTRWSAGVTYEDSHFEQDQGTLNSAFVPESRTLVYPWVGYELIQDRYRKVENLNQIGRTEDVSLGWHASAQVGVASTTYGADRNAFVFGGSVSRGEALSDTEIIEFSSGIAGRVERTRLQNAIISFVGRYYWRQSPRRLFFMSLLADASTHLDADQQITLGGDTGLRGYPLRYQAGSGRWILTAEQRLFSDWYPFRLIRVGGAVFFDMGRTWGANPRGQGSVGLLRDVGFGLRLGHSRSGLGNVTHIDLAFPLDARGAINSVQFLVETKRSF